VAQFILVVLFIRLMGLKVLIILAVIWGLLVLAGWDA